MKGQRGTYCLICCQFVGDLVLEGQEEVDAVNVFLVMLIFIVGPILSLVLL